MKVPAEMLRSVLGLSSVTHRPNIAGLAIAEQTLSAGPASSTRAISISNFTFAPAAITVRAGAYQYFCSLHPHMTGVVNVSA